MLKKDNFYLGFIAAIVMFFVIYSLLNLFTDFSYFSRDRDALWVYMLSIIPTLLLSRFMLVKWEMEKTGRGMMFVSLLGVLFIMYWVLK
jgi:hypothetical protein